MTDAAGWLQVAATGAKPDALEDALLAAGALAVTLTDAADVPILEPELGTHPTWPTTTVTGLFAADADESAVMATVRSEVPATELGGWAATRLEDRDWVRAWMDTFRPMRFGQRLWICPSGMDAELPSDAVVIHLDPGLAFGTGTHPTTDLCLQWLDAAGDQVTGCSVLDMGCGSGVLAVAAGRLGASLIDAVDIDPQAVTASADNARRNHVDLQAMLPDAPRRRATYDIVFANILAGPLIDMAGDLATQLHPGGHLVLAGLLDTQVDAVTAAYAAHGIDLRIGAMQQPWVRLQGQATPTA